VKRENDEGEEDERLAGFMARPVFRIEDTEGETVKYEQIELPNLPLMEKAKEWGISVKPIPGNQSYYGYFSHHRNEIALASKEETVFFSRISSRSPQTLGGYQQMPTMEKRDRGRTRCSGHLPNSWENLKISRKQSQIH